MNRIPESLMEEGTDAACAFPGASTPLQTDFLSEDDHERLLRSFDMIFRLHQKSEEIRAQLDKIDTILLSARTVAGLADELVQTLERDLDLVCARLLIRDGHPMASAVRMNAPRGTGIIPDDFMEYDASLRSEAFVLDDPSGELARSLFGDSVSMVASAAVAYLWLKNEDLGLLCLGSNDPCRYCGDMNTDLIVQVASKISLGFCNAWDHESAIKQAIETPDSEIYSDRFFKAYLAKEFARAWRSHACFSLMAVSAEAGSLDTTLCEEQVIGLLQSTIRSSDLVAQGDTSQFWVLLPDTDAEEAKCAALRLVEGSCKLWRGNTSLHVGITEFSRNAPAHTILLQNARDALQEATEGHEPVVIFAASARA